MESDNADTDEEDIRQTNARLGLNRARDFAADDQGSDDGQQQAGQQQQAEQQQAANVVRKGWLTLPMAYMKPLQMCAVNQFVHCVTTLDSRFLSSGSEYVLVGTGSSMPDHFHQWIYCMHQVIRKYFSDISPCADGL